MLSLKTLRRVRRALADRRGVAAVEFAMIAPLLILLYFGLAELSDAIIAARHTNQSSSSLGDLVAQCSNLNDTDSANIFSAATDILAPLSVTTLQLRATSIMQTTTDPTQTYVQWSQTPTGQTGLTAYALNKQIALPTGLTNNQGDTIIMSEAVYQFNFPIDLFNGLIHFDDLSYYKPRKSPQVTYTGTGPGGTKSTTSCYQS